MFLNIAVLVFLIFFSGLSSGSCEDDFVTTKALGLGEKFSLATWNVERLYQINGRPLSKESRQEKAAFLRGINADAIILTEGEGQEELHRFVKDELAGGFDVFFAPTEDHRGLGVALLLKKGLGLKVEMVSHLEELDDGLQLFPRNLPAFVLTSPVGKFWILGVHLNSLKLRKDQPMTPQNFRKLQIARAARLIQSLEKKWGSYFAVVGDFNNDLKTAAEFKQLWELGLVNPLHDHGDAFSHVYFPWKGPPVAAQLDGILLSEKAAAMTHRPSLHRLPGAPSTLAEAKTFRYETYKTFVSDHSAVKLELK